MTEIKKDAPINLVRLNSYTNGDKEIAKSLTEIFFESAEEDIEKLKNSLNQGGKPWKDAAHSFKGASYTFGAEELGELLRQAELAQELELPVRETLFDSICLEYSRVKEYGKELFF